MMLGAPYGHVAINKVSQMTLPAAAPLTRMFRYLDKLRDSGRTNMYAARPYLQRQFSLEPDEAGEILSAWMKTFDAESEPGARAETAQRGTT